MMTQPTIAALIIDIVGVLAGVISIGVILSSSRTVGGQVGSAFNLVLIGILFQMSAVIYTIVFTRLKLFPAPVVDIHHGLMVIGLVFFVMAARQFAKLSQ